MSNTSKGKATKGSKLMMQMVASPLQRIIIENKLGEQLCWLSPVEESDYEEYQLSDKVACDFMALEVNKNTFSFWPTRQPQWDGIAIGKETGTLYLFGELSTCCPKTKHIKARRFTSPTAFFVTFAKK